MVSSTLFEQLADEFLHKVSQLNVGSVSGKRRDQSIVRMDES